MSNLTQQEVLYILDKLAYAFSCQTKDAVVMKLSAMHETKCRNCGKQLTVNGCMSSSCVPF